MQGKGAGRPVYGHGDRILLNKIGLTSHAKPAGVGSSLGAAFIAEALCYVRIHASAVLRIHGLAVMRCAQVSQSTGQNYCAFSCMVCGVCTHMKKACMS